MKFLAQSIVNIKDLQDILEGCWILAQQLKKESPQDERLLLLCKDIEKARYFEFRFEIKKIQIRK